MSCSGAYAEPWEYAAFWCGGSLMEGLDNGGGLGVLFLTDTSVDFLKTGVKPNVGMVAYNLTKNIQGLITAVSQTTLTATGVTWDNGDIYRVVTITALQIAQINHILTITAGNIHAALGAVDACNCTLSSWGLDFLAKLNIIEAGALHSCPCGSPNLTTEMRRDYLKMINDQLGLIRSGEIDPCEGATGSKFPAQTWAEMGSTVFAVEDIVTNDLLRNP